MERSLQDIKEEVKARTDIVELIGGHTRLKRSGKSWTGLCPFHADKKPSFNVSPHIGIYKCWSCGETGDIFTFVQKKEGLDFIEALEWLARRAGIPFTRSAGSAGKMSEREEALELNRIAVAFYQDRLTRSSDARNLLAERAILKPTQEQWEIGFAPPDWDGLVRHLERLKANLALAAKIGLIKERKTEGSGYFDFLRNRLIFPIHDIGGRGVIAFGGRAISKDEKAKYLNSDASFLFNKSNTLYGLHFARRKLSSDTPAVFVEGYVDVIATHQAGFTQCIATLGTSLTEEHAKLLVRYNPKVIICYDADTAGINATLKGTKIWENVGVEGAEVRVARLPAGEDPDSLLRSGETALFQAALDNAIPRAEFEIELVMKRNNIQSEAGKASALAEIIPILASISSHTKRALYVDKIAHLHPLYDHIGLARAIEQIVADVEQYARQSHNGQSPRDQGYPRTQEQNGQSLAQNPPPPTYPSPNRQWNRNEWPHTQNIVRKGEGGPNDRSRWNDKRRRDPNRPMFSDPTPPELSAPALTGPEKAERQLLRALFTAEWRTYILSRLPSDCFVTENGKRLFALVARTPATEDGSIDPLTLLRRVEREEDDPTTTVSPTFAPVSPSDPEEIEEDPYAGEAFPVENKAFSSVDEALSEEREALSPVEAALSPDREEFSLGEDNSSQEEDPFAEEEIPPEEAEAFGITNHALKNEETTFPAPPEATPQNSPFPVSAANEVGKRDGGLGAPEENFSGWEGISEGDVERADTGILRREAKISAFLREVLEDSTFLPPNEHLKQKTVDACIELLQKHRTEKEERELRLLLDQPDLTPEQRRAFATRYRQIVQEIRGTHRDADEEQSAD
jgi:DNA primase